MMFSTDMTSICSYGKSIRNNSLGMQEPVFNEAVSQASPFLKAKTEVVASLSNLYLMCIDGEGPLAQRIQLLVVFCRGRCRIFAGIPVTQLQHRGDYETDTKSGGQDSEEFP